MAFADLPPGTHAETVRNHWWWRPGWRVGRRFYAFHITFADKPELTTVAAKYQAALAHLPGLTLIPGQWLHLTMQGVGFTDELTPAEVSQLIDTACDAIGEVEPVWGVFAGAIVADEAIVLPVQPEDPVKQLRTAIRAAIGRVLGDDRVPENAAKFRPHISVAYFTNRASATPYVKAVTSVNALSAGVRFDTISLIEMHRDHEMYMWRTIEHFVAT